MEAAAGDKAADRTTVVALQEDRNVALDHLRRLSPSKAQKVVLKDLRHSHLLSAPFSLLTLTSKTPVLLPLKNPSTVGSQT